MSYRNAIRSQARQIVVTDPIYRTRVTAHAILKVHEEDAMNDELFVPLSIIERADWHIKQNVIAQSKLSRRR